MLKVYYVKYVSVYNTGDMFYCERPDGSCFYSKEEKDAKTFYSKAGAEAIKQREEGKPKQTFYIVSGKWYTKKNRHSLI